MVATTVLFALAAWRTDVGLELAAFSVFLGAAAPLAIIDVCERRLPNRLLIPTGLTVTSLLMGAAHRAGDWASLGRAAVASVVLFSAFLAVALISRGGLGAGDVRLAGLLGLLLGWSGWTVLVGGVLLGLGLGAAHGALVILAGGTRHSALPLGPALIAGAVTVLLLAS
ncbi:prepilin peptidase [Actinoalloteichus caeruleus]|uniref:prepilin peptidase n=1 Tax=Actinoalloteichus cyanogriseus TaxID=2893586 RepID=UPI003AAA7A06